jgi:hypothetical protein
MDNRPRILKGKFLTQVWDLKMMQTPLMTVKNGDCVWGIAVREDWRSLDGREGSGAIAALLDDGSTRIYDLHGSKIGTLRQTGAGVGGASDQSVVDTSSHIRTHRQGCSVLWMPEADALLTAGFDPPVIQKWTPPSQGNGGNQ